MTSYPGGTHVLNVLLFFRGLRRFPHGPAIYTALLENLFFPSVSGGKERERNLGMREVR